MSEPDEPEEVICSECGKPLADDWGGLLACFCAWGGLPPSADDVVNHAEKIRWN